MLLPRHRAMTLFRSLPLTLLLGSAAPALANLDSAQEEPDRVTPIINELETDESVEEVEQSTLRGEPVAPPEIGTLTTGPAERTAAELTTPGSQSPADLAANPVAQIPDESLAIVMEALPSPQPAAPLSLLGSEVLPGSSARLAWSPGIQIPGLSQPTPVLAVNGIHAGPTLCLTGAIHGDELNGIEIVRRTIYDLDPEELSGRVIGVPIVNLPGFQQGSRYLPDRRDLNRHFPGSPDGSLADRIAHSLFENVIRQCDMLVDIHTGSLKRTNLPQLRADMNNPDVATFTQGFDRMAVVHSSGSSGMLRSAAVAAGIVAVTLEAGESHRIQEHQIEAGVNSLTSLMEKQGMTSRMFVWGEPEPVYYDSDWIRAQHGGILFSEVDLGAHVSEGEVLGYVADPITNAQYPIRAHSNGRVIGMAVDQVVMAGFAAYHIGTEAEIPAE
ncbi:MULTISPECIES: succinylglutamate desuccinylase/aspartoacylase family protein [Marinobacter]|uniref:Succinylglutamate desuccinylase/aspartoacylase family protein n=1 Tax=Marinobacter suaedae TaxID=3057675 RepID=A0ABT8VZE6_9GAMM|nr:MULTISPECIES: succinylglutamate desuccinylase/aspartoacylase family protein [unclassified Marinobacter]MBZ2169433.1 succinylglutamate desuccinylase/aspartoacylase family protein [Marinobacter sp. F4216]MDO3721298.1 succinylglutamate desuccinylase/aspartoacylase family protein [Marinobacter sp. chi1]